MSEKRLIISLFFLFAVSAVYLISVNIRGVNPEGKNWWSLAFTEPAIETSQTFTVTNHTDEASFRYTVTQDNVIIDSGEFSVPTGTSEIKQPQLKSKLGPGRITITVTHGDTEETIYRSL